MIYASLMVHLKIDQSSADLLAIAGEMAERFHSRVIGIATGQPLITMSGDGYVSGDLVEQDIADRKAKIGSLETEFRTALQKRNTVVEWRSKISYGPPVDYLAAESRCADLILTGASGKALFNGPDAYETGELVLQSGRPVIVVPTSAKTVKLDKIVVCWRDTREARRAILDSLELLKQARAVDVVEVTTDDGMPACRSRLHDVVAWLALHGVSAMPVATSADGDEQAILASLIEEREGDFIVAGAYGHNRFREWMFGGATRDLWMQPTHCCMLSH